MLRHVDSREPGDSLLRDIEAWAVELVRRAGEMALERFRRPMQVEYKQQGRRDPVTDVDRGVEQFLRSAIAREFPQHGVLGEEGTETDGAGHDYLWVLDPIDGTSNYVNGLPLFGCSAGLLYRGEPVVGAIFLPVAPRAGDSTKEVVGEAAASVPAWGSGVLHARLRMGTHLDGTRVFASTAERPEPTALAGLPAHHARQFRRRERLREVPGELRCLGSVCFETAMVACGVLQYGVFRRPRLWDLAAGALLVREAGGRILRWRRNRWEPLGRFEAMANPARPDEEGLRYWTATTLLGGSRVAGYVAERLRPKAGLRDRVADLMLGFLRG